MDSTSYRSDGFGRATWTVAVPIFKLREVINSKTAYHQERVKFWEGTYRKIVDPDDDDVQEYSESRKKACLNKIAAHKQQIKECEDWSALFRMDSDGKTEVQMTLDDAKHFGIRRYFKEGK